MNVLLYVMTMLMVLALMSYARLETYRNARIFQSLFTHYMDKDERAVINKGFQEQYDNVKNAQKKEGENKRAEKIAASPRINLGLLLDKEKQAANPDQMQQTVHLLKNLIHVLYSSQSFYEALIKERPQFADELVTSMNNAIEALPSKNRPKKIKDLSNLVLSDPVLNEALYKFLHGAPEKYVEEPPSAEPERKNEDNIEDSESDAQLLAQEAEEHQSPKGYTSLADFITFASSPQVRIFLASPHVLQAIFHNPQAVHEIIEMRKELHRQALGGAELKELESAFKGKFEQLRDPAIDPALLNFQVSKTDPRKYE